MLLGKWKAGSQIDRSILEKDVISVKCSIQQVDLAHQWEKNIIKENSQDHTPLQKENSFLFFSYPSVNTTALEFTVWYSLRQKALKNQPNDIHENNKEIEITCQQKNK